MEEFETFKSEAPLRTVPDAPDRRRRERKGKRSKEVRRNACDHCEHRVNDQTAELISTNERLQREILQHKHAEKALKESEKKLRLITENIREVFWMSDADGRRMIYISPGYEQIWGRTCESLYEQPLSFMDAIHVDDRPRVMHIFETLMRAEPIQLEYRIIRPDGSVRWIWSRAYPVLGQSGKLRGIVVIAEDCTQRKEAEAALRESEKKLRNLSSHLLTAQERERRRISLELHDELGQDLSTLKLHVSCIEAKLRKDQGALKEGCRETLNYIDQIIENVRRLSLDLSPSMLEHLGLSAALRCLIEDFRKHPNIKISFDAANIDDLFSREEQIIIYRIFQEALTNIGRHAQATFVSASIKKDSKGVSFLVQDNGRGFDMKKIALKDPLERGMGLAAMDERARMLGCFLEISTKEGKGTRISLNIPTDKRRPGE